MYFALTHQAMTTSNRTIPDRSPSGSTRTEPSIIIIINLLTARVVAVPQMILQPVFSIFPCSPMPSGTWRTPGHSLMLSSHLFLCLPCLLSPFTVPCKMVWPDLMNGKHDHTTAVCVFLRSSGDLHVVLLPAGFWHGLPRW